MKEVDLEEELDYEDEPQTSADKENEQEDHSEKGNV